MAAAPSVLSTAQFGRGMAPKKTDPSGDPKFNKPKFTGGTGSKTMHISKGHVPKPPGIHPHHRKAGKRSRRAH